MNQWFPFLDWMKKYDLKEDFKGDMIAGLIVAIMLIPQGMAYAMLAGLPPVMGLYASTVPLILYALFGTSRQLSVGPVAMVSLLIFTGVSGLAEPGSDQYISLVFLLAFMVGVIQLLMGIFKLGAISKFISHAVISGFTSAAAIIIGMSQLKHLIGVEIEASNNVFLIIAEVFTRLNEIHLPTLLIGLGSIFILVLFKKKIKKIPGALVVVVTMIAIVGFLQLNEIGVGIVGNVPDGLPSLSIPSLNIPAINTLLPIAFTIVIIGFVESYAMAKVIATKERYTIHANKELNGLGIANIGTSFFSGFPVTGGFSRSAVNYDAGARTGLASIITGAIILLTLLFFTSWFYYLPQAVLAAIIIVAVYGLIDVKEVFHLWNIKRIDAISLLVTFSATLVIGIEAGIATGVVFSILNFVYRSSKPHMAELGYIEENQTYRNVNRYPMAKTKDDVLIVRIDAAIYFANISYIEERLSDFINNKQDLKAIILDFSGVNDMDAVAIDDLGKWIDQIREENVKISLAQVKGPVRDLLKKAGWTKKYGDVIQHPTIETALLKLGK
ncbi:sodium-independent anion transporter [Salipaludibacillus keqinensis]|uniref:Sodium-independent anion transporter n=1 Tax=Salipaludibacillus keqinensis TaxID=2045207 RepID=A0A323TAT5_9BACI|nr:solute carrier family 26 protein [Salipaludibacillus keqinensis]PYZ92349.1 sodium-independent anion transporter [Salipaludibacillus keqinensis]